MSQTPFQPILPAEIPPTQAERHIIEETPSIFPDNQDSNWGLKRKVFADQQQKLIDQQSLIYSERFVESSEQFLDDWEFEVGLPENPTGVSLADRRVRVQGQLHAGPFTHKRIAGIIEPYILATFGSAPRFSAAGLSLAGGIQLLADASGDPKQYYRVYEDVRNYAYEVWIKSSVTPALALQRDLQRITPAGIALTFDNTKAEIIDYERVIRNAQPVAYYRFNGNVNDSSGYGYNGVLAGGSHDPAAIASPGLLDSNVAGGSAALNLDGTDDYFDITTTGALAINTGKWTVEAIVRPDSFPVSHNQYILYSANAQLFIGVGSGGIPKLAGSAYTGTTNWFVQTTGSNADFVTGTSYRIGISYDGSFVRLYKNGVMVFSQAAPGASPVWSGVLRIGTPNISTGPFADIGLDELAFYNYPLSDAQFAEHNKAAQNIYT